jgi:hypothetical protein
MNDLLREGSRTPEVAQIQQKLKAMGLYNGAIDGIYGPQTSNAIRQFQTQAGIKIDGIVGPQTRGALNAGSSTVTPPTGNTSTTPSGAPSPDNVTPEELRAGMVAHLGRDVTQDEWNKIQDAYYGNMGGYYNELQNYDKASLDNQLGLQQRNFNSYLDQSANQFKQDKTANDVSSAQRGVLFSTSRNNDLTNLQNQYDSDLASKKDAYQTNMKNQLMNYQNEWGTAGMQNSGLQNYYSLGGQSYDAFTPGGKTQGTGLSSFYNPSSLSLSGKKIQERTTKAATKTGNYFQNLMNQANSSKSTYNPTFN